MFISARSLGRGGVEYASVPGAELYPSLSGTALPYDAVAVSASGGPDGGDSSAVSAATTPLPFQSLIQKRRFLINQQREEEEGEEDERDGWPRTAPFKPLYALWYSP